MILVKVYYLQIDYHCPTLPQSWIDKIHATLLKQFITSKKTGLHGYKADTKLSYTVSAGYDWFPWTFTVDRELGVGDICLEGLVALHRRQWPDLPPMVSSLSLP